mgnify:CR=1 FL=1
MNTRCRPTFLALSLLAAGACAQDSLPTPPPEESPGPVLQPRLQRVRDAAGRLIGAPRAVYDQPDLRRPTTDYDIEGRTLLANATQIWLSFMLRRGPDMWPGDFREAFVTALMAELALSVREDRSLFDRLYVKAFGTPQQMGVGGLYGTALEQDAQGVPSTVVGGGYNPLIDVRY